MIGGKSSPKSMKNSIGSTLRKWRSTLRKVTHDTLNSLDEVTANEEKIDALFDGEGGKTVNWGPVRTSKNGLVQVHEEDMLEEDVTNDLKSSSFGFEKSTTAQPVGIQGLLKSGSIEQISSGSRSLVGGVGGTSMRLSEESEEGGSTTGTGNKHEQLTIMKSSSGGSQGVSHKEKLTYDNFDAVAECNKLRQRSDKPFVGGPKIWEKRRKLWCEPSVSAEEIAHRRENGRGVFDAIPEAYHTSVYKKLVVDNKPLKEPLNLSHAMKVINAGWIDTKKWANAGKGLP